MVKKKSFFCKAVGFLYNFLILNCKGTAENKNSFGIETNRVESTPSTSRVDAWLQFSYGGGFDPKLKVVCFWSKFKFEKIHIYRMFNEDIRLKFFDF